eukprot:scaffold51701_cov22-Prasinocladus_malaysianus.AAC.1
MEFVLPTHQVNCSLMVPSQKVFQVGGKFNMFCVAGMYGRNMCPTDQNEAAGFVLGPAGSLRNVDRPIQFQWI